MSFDPDLKRVDPVLPVAPWLGGKRVLSRRLVNIIAEVPHKIYAEPFVGMGGVFLRRRSRPGSEVINDLGRDVSNLFRILQRHYPQFIDTLKFQLTTRAEFYRLVSTDPATLTDLERAARFLYLQRTAFGGKVSGRNFGVSPDRPARFNLASLEPMLEDLHSRLTGVVIECLDWAEFIPRYDRDHTLFYIDPPYWGNEGDYGKGMFERSDFVKMSSVLGQIEGRFLLSLNDNEDVRAVFAPFQLNPVSVSYSVAREQKGRSSRPELIISNFNLPDNCA